MLLGEPRVLVLGSASLSLLVWATRTVLLGTVRWSAIGKVGPGDRGAIERKPGWALPLTGENSEDSEAPHQLTCSEPPRALKYKRCRWERPCQALQHPGPPTGQPQPSASLHCPVPVWTWIASWAWECYSTLSRPGDRKLHPTWKICIDLCVTGLEAY